MASFCTRNNTSGSSFKSISGAMLREEASDFHLAFESVWWSLLSIGKNLRGSWMKTALLLLCVSVLRRPLQHKIVLFENTSSLWAETTRKKKKNEKAAIKSHKRASQTGNCDSVLACNVNKEHSTWKLSLHQIPQVVCFSGFMDNFVDVKSKFSSHLTKLFLTRATARADLWTS